MTNRLIHVQMYVQAQDCLYLHVCKTLYKTFAINSISVIFLFYYSYIFYNYNNIYNYIIVVCSFGSVLPLGCWSTSSWEGVRALQLPGSAHLRQGRNSGQVPQEELVSIKFFLILQQTLHNHAHVHLQWESDADWSRWCQD